MSRYLTPRQFLRMAVASFIILIIVLAIIQSRRGDEAEIAVPLRREEADALVSELARCRTVTLDQTASLETCRRLWAENRRQFFAPSKVPPAPIEPVPLSSRDPGKNQDRLSPAAAEHRPRGVQ